MSYSQYHGRCAGRVMHFLYSISPNFDEMAKIGDKVVYYGTQCVDNEIRNGPTLCTYEWVGDTDFIEIIFCERFKEYQELWEFTIPLLKQEEQKRYQEIGKQPYSHSVHLLEIERRKEERKLIRNNF